MNPTDDELAGVVAALAFAVAVVAGFAIGAWAVIELFVRFDGNFRG